MRIRDQSELKFGLNVAERLFFRGPYIFGVSESGKYDFLVETFDRVGDSWVSKLQALLSFLYVLSESSRYFENTALARHKSPK